MQYPLLLGPGIVPDVRELNDLNFVLQGVYNLVRETGIYTNGGKMETRVFSTDKTSHKFKVQLTINFIQASI